IPPALLARPGADLSLGSDSNLRIDFTEEMRLLEYAQRLRAQKRGIFVDGSGSVASRLFEIATRGGARCLRLRAGEIESGYVADFVTLDLESPRVLSSSPEELMSAFILGAGSEAIERVAVSGRWIL
ncbi:MAG TPA: amidohydrolase family protein, partial [Vicinamibacteria bacterium]